MTKSEIHIETNGRHVWFKNNLVHREDGPAIIVDTKKEKQLNSTLVGINVDDNKIWYMRNSNNQDEKVKYTFSKIYTLMDKPYYAWCLQGKSYKFEDWCRILKKSDDEITLLKLKY